jgi:hypothetical protein
MERPDIEGIVARRDEWELRRGWSHATTFESDKELAAQLIGDDLRDLLAYVSELTGGPQTVSEPSLMAGARYVDNGTGT